MSEPQLSRQPWTGRVVEAFLRSNLSAMLVIVALLAGGVALWVTPREEEPQIIVPLADVMVSVPGASAREVERQVATRLEKLLYQIDGVEYVYSMSRADQAVVTVRFYVGEDREDSLVKLYNKISMNTDVVPPQVAGWVVKPIEIDDVPVVAVTLWSDRYDDFTLRRMAEELELRLGEVPGTGRTEVIGGPERQVRVLFDPDQMASRGVSVQQLANALRGANVTLPANGFDHADRRYAVEAGTAFASVDELADLVIGVAGGRPVYLREVARVVDGPAEPTDYCRFGFGPAAEEAVDAVGRESGHDFPAVTVAVSKRKGWDARRVSAAVQQRVEQLKSSVLPEGVQARITRDYGKTANDKVNELVEGLAVAIVIVIALIAVTLGWREGLIVATAVPITFALTLLINWLAGYTINRVTLFALILALGLVVDDPIVDVENIFRHLKMRKQKPLAAVLTAVNEVRPPIILATLAVIVSFIPMLFITGMMGPYMRPMALNVPLAMLMSLVVAFTITPWMSYHVLKGEYGKGEEKPYVLEDSLVYRAYRAAIQPMLTRRAARWTLLGVMVVLFGFSCWLAMDRRVPLKMLPFDNKNELQVVVDMPEGTTLERTEAVTADLARYLRGVGEVTDVITYVGTASPMDFNSMVRHYYLRRGPNVADIRVNFVHKYERRQQSHEMALRIRNDLTAIAQRNGANIKVVEVPPGPPVLSTVVAEIYGQPYHSYEDLIAAVHTVRQRLTDEPGVVDVDDTIEAEQVKLRFILDKEKAALAGLSTFEVAEVVRAAVAGTPVSVMRLGDEVNPLAIVIQLSVAKRSDVALLSQMYVSGRGGRMVQLAEMGRFEQTRVDQTIYHKNLRRVVYVFAEMAGRAPAEAILDVEADQDIASAASARPLAARSYLDNGGGVGWSVGDGIEVVFSGEGEWKITIDVFRDLGIAFAAACMGIYILLVYETGSYLMPLILMISIPLTIIGIMPGFWLLNAIGVHTVGPAGGVLFGNLWPTPTFFTATGMIGMIALSGIAVRNAILLIEFVHKGTAAGKPLTQAIIESGAVRFRPIFLTAGTAMLAAWPITLDPIFSGLAWALIFGLFVSTAFTLVVIPTVYYMVYGRGAAAGA
ncbi:MAG TPA: efflux RND transporter permease subunit [Phycisphaerae bacterium]|nr:efflux RND transporter permease subunit [Phycisphaerae bacterium]